MRLLTSLALILALPASAAAPNKEGGPLILPPVDVAGAVAQDAIDAEDLAKPWRFGVQVPVAADMDTWGTWSVGVDGGRVWRGQVRSVDAVQLNVQMEGFHLPDGAALVISNRQDARRVLTSAQNSASGELGTLPLLGDTLTFTYSEPADAAFEGEFRLVSVVHGYRSLYDRPRLDRVNESGSCNINVVCSEADDYRAQVDAEALTMAPSYVCSGTLINNTAQDRSPLMLTANHCLANNHNNWLFLFNYQSSTCSNPSSDPDYDVVHGATLLASNANSDFGLFELNEPVPPTYNGYYAGWDRSGVAPSGAAVIHHPAGDIKKFSREFDALRTDPDDANFWQIVDWDQGTTEGGSSGSGLFDPNKRLIGQLFGGQAACGNNGSDFFGKLSSSWDSGSSSRSRLSDWLDPLGTGAVTLDGVPTTSAEDDGALAGFTSPPDGGDMCAGRPSVTLVNRGTARLRSATIEYRVDGGSWDSDSWSGNLDFGESEEVELRVTLSDLGAHTIDARLTVDGDTNPANDDASSSFGVIEATGGDLPVFADFDAGMATNLDVVSTFSDAYGWEAVSVDSYGDGSGAVGVNNLDNDTSGTVDALRVPAVDLSGARNPVLRFDYAYAQYGQQYADGLRIVAVDTCSGSRTVLWEKYGSDLATAPETTDAFVPGANDWRSVEVDLSAYGDGIIAIDIENVGGYGQWVYLDDVSVTDGGNGGGGGGGTACSCSSGPTGAGWLALAPLGAVLLRRRRRGVVA